ncbi:MAG: ABC transporter permease subunit [Deltaproteobacteria bacterium]|jgi:polar amino acid transport system permease protein|nr:ABC transporter permease subunit [Deltaproteobacteria bacterium]
MDTSAKNQLSVKPASYNMWVGVFVVCLLIVIGLFYYATQKIEYVWRWNRMPIYFAYQDTIEINAEIEGEVDRIVRKDKQAVVTVKNETETASYTVPITGLTVVEGEIISLGDNIGEYNEWKPGLLVIGLWITLKLSIIATIFGVLIGVAGGLARISSNPALKWATIVYVEIIRGSPLMVQILIWYYVIGTVVNDLLSTYGLGRISAFWYGVASLACFAGAYVTEIVRAGIQSIHRGQTEAARSLGMTYAQCLRYIILPQALRRILPPLAGQFISLIKDSSLLGIIAIRELTKAGREAVSASLQPFEIYLVVAVLYLVLTFSLSMFVQHLERRSAVK